MGKSEFEKYAAGHAGISSLKLHRFNTITQEYISPTIIEERLSLIHISIVASSSARGSSVADACGSISFCTLMYPVSYTHLKTE